MFAKFMRVSVALATSFSVSLASAQAQTQGQAEDQPQSQSMASTAPTKKPVDTSAKAAKPAKKPTKPSLAKTDNRVFPFIPFKKIAQLHPRQRIRYLAAFRQIAVDLEKTQIAFALKRNAEIDKTKQNELYAAVFGSAAYADDPNIDLRGIQASDQCINCFWVETYEHPEKHEIKKYQCKNEHPCAGMKGISCDQNITGIFSGNDNCISASQEYKATQLIAKRMHDMSSDPKNIPGIRDAVNGAHEFLKFSSCDRSLPDAAFNKCISDKASGEEAADMIHELVMHMYDDDAYQTLFGVIGYYQRNGLTEPNAGNVGTQEDKTFKNLAAKFDFQTFMQSTEAAQDGLNHVYADYDHHCKKAIGQAEQDDIRKYNPATDHNPDYLKNREIGRKTNLQNNPSNPTVRNTKEDEECYAFYARVDKGRAEIIETANSGPMIRPKAPIPTEIPRTPTIDEPDSRSAGCGGPVFRDNAELYQKGAQCMVCPEENAAHQYSEQLKKRYDSASDSERTGLNKAIAKYEKYQVSTKFDSLKTSMAMACGDSIVDGTEVTTAMQAQYTEAFGHCASNTGYQWPTSHVAGSPEDSGTAEEFIQFINNGTPWDMGDDCKHNKDQIKVIDAKFKEFFGIGYYDATELFCPKGRVHKTWLWRNYKCKDDISDVNQSPEEFKKAARERVNDKTIDKYKGKMSEALYTCMKEATETAKNLYPDNQICLQTKQATKYPDLASFPAAALDAGGTAVISNGSGCYDSNVKSDYHGMKGVGYTKPSSFNDSYRSTGIYVGHSTNLPNIVTYTTQDSNDCLQSDGTTVGHCQLGTQLDRAGTYQVTIESPTCRQQWNPEVKNMKYFDNDSMSK